MFEKKLIIIAILLSSLFCGVSFIARPAFCAEESSKIDLTAPFVRLINVISKELNPPEEKPEGPSKEKPEEVKVLAEAGMERIGAESAYEEFEGLRFGRYFTIGQRIEIYQEARPIDSYMLDAKMMSTLYRYPWNTDVDYRSQIIPQFARVYGTQITMNKPGDREAQIRCTIDYRDIYKQYYPKYTSFKVERWTQADVFFIHSKKIPGIDWYYTSNLGYRYSTIEPKSDQTGYENRHTYEASLSLAPSAQFEWFGKFQYYKSMRVKSDFHYRPEHWYWRTEFRMKSRDLKTSTIPAISYSIDYYFPFKNKYEKYELSCRVGHDFDAKLSGTTQLNYMLGLRDEPDNKAPWYDGTMYPYTDHAAWAGIENKVSYNFWNDFYLQAGLDFSKGMNMSDFDNWATLLGVEYYKPGVLRVNFGWDTNWYYNIEDTLSMVGVKVYILM